MCDPNCTPSRADSDQSDFETVETAWVDETCDFDLPSDTCSPHIGGIVDALGVVVRDVADCVPVRVAILDSHFRIRALNAEWSRLRPLGVGILGQPFEACLSTASVSARNAVKACLARLVLGQSEGFVPSISLELDGTRRCFTLHARTLPQTSALVVVALLDITDRGHRAAERQTIARIVLDAEEAERRRIARELHDETAQQLAAMQFGLAGLRECGTGRKFASMCGDIEDMLRSVQNELRTLSYILHPPEIDDAGLAEALRRFVNGFARRTQLKAIFVNETGRVWTDSAMDRAVYRVAQEALINVGKHADATNARVSLRGHGQQLVLEVEDDGIGIAPELCSSRSDARLGVGLSAMRERIEALAGSLEVSRLNTGTRIRAIVPYSCLRQ